MSLFFELAKAADKLVKKLLYVKAGEEFLIYADTSSDRRVVEITAASGYALDATVTVAWYETRPVIAMEPPRTVAAAMAAADVICELATQYIIHTKAFRNALTAGARHICLPGMDVESLIRLKPDQLVSSRRNRFYRRVPYKR